MNYKIEDIQISDLPQIHALNESELPHVSHLSLSDLQELSAEAVYFRKIIDGSTIAGFVLGLDETASYKSLNFLWFKKNYQNFLYIDRIVVADSHRRQGIGRKLYADVDRVAVDKNLSWVTCEVNVLPPNPESMRYHEALGFKPVGEQETEGGKKRVSLLAKSVLKASKPR